MVMNNTARLSGDNIGKKQAMRDGVSKWFRLLYTVVTMKYTCLLCWVLRWVGALGLPLWGVGVDQEGMTVTFIATHHKWLDGVMFKLILKVVGMNGETLQMTRLAAMMSHVILVG